MKAPVWQTSGIMKSDSLICIIIIYTSELLTEVKESRYPPFLAGKLEINKLRFENYKNVCKRELEKPFLICTMLRLVWKDKGIVWF